MQAHSMKVVEATGAGDAFAAGFVSGLIRGKDVEFALQLGLANAESVISHKGAKSKLLKYDEALHIIKNNPSKISPL